MRIVNQELRIGGRATRIRGRMLLFIPLLWIGLNSSGCSSTPKPIFQEIHPPIVWPPPPAKERIRYVGELRSSADLMAPRKFFKAIGDFLVGSDPPNYLYGPRAVVCTEDGNRVWVVDPGGRCLHLFNLKDRSYKKITRVGKSLFLSPVGLCLGPNDSIYVCDSENVGIHQISASTGSLIRSLPLPQEIGRPVALSYNATREELFVVDIKAHNIKVLGPEGHLLRVIGQRGEKKGEFNFPCGIVDDGKILWVVDTGNHRVQGLTYSGEYFSSFGRVGDAPGNLALPKGIAVDSEGHLYVIDSRFENLQIFDPSGNLLLRIGEEGTGPGEFWLPSGIFIDGNDRIWICDSYNRRLQVFDFVNQPAPPNEERQ